MSGAADGIKVLDFTWYGVGPITTKYLADNGAEVVKVETTTHPDGLRVAPPWKDGVPGLNRSQLFGGYNSSKKSITLNMSLPRAQEIAQRLAPHFDVVADSFTPGLMQRWGLGYEELSAANPSVIQLSTCMQGQTGPRRHYPGFGNQMASISGFYYVAGYAAGDIAPPHGPYTDFIAPKFACFALLAAIDHRRRTGQGQFIDLSQFEASLHFLAPAITDYFATGNVMTPEGNRSLRYSPHGAYRCLDDGDEERWITIAVETDVEWLALLDVFGAGDGPEPFATALGRLAHHRDVDDFVGQLVRSRDATELTLALQAAGVAAYPVQSCMDLRADENLEDWEFFRWLDQTECGPMPYDGPAYRLEGTPSELSAAPNIGEHTEEVLGGLLGMTTSEIKELVDDGTLV